MNGITDGPVVLRSFAMLVTHVKLRKHNRGRVKSDVLPVMKARVDGPATLDF